MKPQPQLAFMMKGQMFDGYLLVKAASQRTSSNGSKYLDLTLCDITGEVNAKMWDSMTLPPAIAEPVRVRGMMQEYNNRAQLRIDKMRDVTENDDLDLSLLTPVAPYPATEMMELINARIEKMQDESLKALLKALEATGYTGPFLYEVGMEPPRLTDRTTPRTLDEFTRNYRRAVPGSNC